MTTPATTAGTKPAAPRVESLDGLRGALALSVAVYHLLGWVYDIYLPTIGTYAVAGFFVLSGFAMTRSYRSTDSSFPLHRYTVARVGRILPLWWVATIATVLTGLPSFAGWSRLVENLTLLSALTPTQDIAVGGWSIEIETVFYLLFPGIILLVRSIRALVALFVASLVIRALYLPTTFVESTTTPEAALYFQMPTFLAFFIGGILLAHLRVDERPTRDRLLAAVGVALFALLFSLSGLGLRTLLTGPVATVLVLVCIAAVGLVSLSPNPQHAGLRWTYVALGSISYAAYLLHPVIYVGVHRLGLPAAVEVVATLVLTIVAGWLSFNYFERPAAIWFRRRFAPPPAHRPTTG